MIWWSAWESEAKAFCQWLVKRCHRQAPHAILEEQSQANRGRVEKRVKVL